LDKVKALFVQDELYRRCETQHSGSAYPYVHVEVRAELPALEERGLCDINSQAWTGIVPSPSEHIHRET
jgi:hypothetical protein